MRAARVVLASLRHERFRCPAANAAAIAAADGNHGACLNPVGLAPARPISLILHVLVHYTDEVQVLQA